MYIKLKNSDFKLQKMINFENFEIFPTNTGFYLTSVGFFPYTEGQYVERATGSPDNIFIYCSKGAGFIKISESIVKLEKNDFFIIPKNVPHVYFSSTSDPWSIYWAHFGEITPANHLILNSVIPIVSRDLQISVKLLFTQIISVLEFNRNKETINFSNYTFEYIFRTLNFFLESNIQNEITDTVSDIAKMVNYIDENIHIPISIGKLQEISSLSESSIYRLFIKNFDASPIDYINGKKLELSKKLLLNTSLSVKEISMRVGFSDPLYFSKIFKKHFFMSPIKFRNSKK